MYDIVNNWVWNAIGKVFNSDNTEFRRFIKRSSGKFSLDDLHKFCWEKEKYSQYDKEYILKVMVDSDLCFRWEDNRYMSIELLEPWGKVEDFILGRLKNSTADADILVVYDDLCYDIASRLLNRLGTRINTYGLFWKYGCHFYELNTMSRSIVTSNMDSVSIRIWEGNSSLLAENLLKVLDSVSMGRKYKVNREIRL